MPAKIYGLYPKKEIRIGSMLIMQSGTDKKVILTDEMVVDGSKYNPYSDLNYFIWPTKYY